MNMHVLMFRYTVKNYRIGKNDSGKLQKLRKIVSIDMNFGFNVIFYCVSKHVLCEF